MSNCRLPERVTGGSRRPNGTSGPNRRGKHSFPGVDRADRPQHFLIQSGLYQVSPGPQFHRGAHIALVTRPHDDLRIGKLAANWAIALLDIVMPFLRERSRYGRVRWRLTIVNSASREL